MLGRITAVLVEEGEVVRQGQALVQMQDDDLRAQLAQAEARLEEAQARLAEIEAGARPQELEAARAQEREAGAVLDAATAALARSRELFAGGLTARAELDEAERQRKVALAQAESARERLSLIEAGAREEVRRAARAQVKTAEADVAHARVLVDHSVIRAPVAGKVLRRFMQPGEVIVMQRRSRSDLADLSRIRCARRSTRPTPVSRGRTAGIAADAYRGRVFKGTVVAVGATAGRKNLISEKPAEPMDAKVVEVLIELPDPHPWTFGMSVDVSVTVEARDDVPVVPRSAVKQEHGGATVLVRKGGSFVPQAVRIGASDADYVEILALEGGRRCPLW
jgi:multidrug resistance efflux pump